MYDNYSIITGRTNRACVCIYMSFSIIQSAPSFFYNFICEDSESRVVLMISFFAVYKRYHNEEGLLALFTGPCHNFIE